MEAHVGLQNCSYNQFTTLSLRVFMRVNVRHINVSAVKNNYNGKNTAAAEEDSVAVKLRTFTPRALCVNSSRLSYT